MGNRYNSTGATRFSCRSLSDGDYKISWVVDYYYPDSRLRYPRKFSRITDMDGARRFCKRHNLNIPLRRNGKFEPSGTRTLDTLIKSQVLYTSPA